MDATAHLTMEDSAKPLPTQPPAKLPSEGTSHLAQDNSNPTPPGAPLDRLPAELKFEAFQGLSRRDYKALCLVSKAINPVATSFLYQDFTNYQKHVSQTAIDDGRVILNRLFYTLSRKPELAKYFKRIHLVESPYTEQPTEQELDIYNKLLQKVTAASKSLVQDLERRLHEGNCRAKVALLLLISTNVEHISLSLHWLHMSSQFCNGPQQSGFDEIIQSLFDRGDDVASVTFNKLRSINYRASGDSITSGSDVKLEEPAPNFWQNVQAFCRLPGLRALSLGSHMSGWELCQPKDIQSWPNIETLSLDADEIHPQNLEFAARLPRKLKRFEVQWGGRSYIYPHDAIKALMRHASSLLSLKLCKLSSIYPTHGTITTLRDFTQLTHLTIDISFLSFEFDVDVLEHALSELLPLRLKNLIICTNEIIYSFIEIFGRAALAVPHRLLTQSQSTFLIAQTPWRGSEKRIFPHLRLHSRRRLTVS